MIFFLYSLTILFLAALPVCMFMKNLPLFRTATRDQELLQQATHERVSILIPARNEAASIGVAIDRIMENRSMNFELLVLDDQSEDDTAAIVRQRIQTSIHSPAYGPSSRVEDGARGTSFMLGSRIRLIESIPLPAGWNGKQHACWRLAEASQFDWLLFLDADVRLSENAVQRMIAEGLRGKSSLVSGFPHQQTGSLSERMLIPLMHYILLGYLPILQLRASTAPSLSAGCGQMMLARRADYFACDGHRAIRSSRHDGIQLPKAFRKHGFATDIFDATDIASCRMYRNRREVVTGLLKNATEGIANGRLIVLFSILLSGAALLPIPSLIFACWKRQSVWAIAALVVASLCVFVPPILAVRRFYQSIIGALLHPISVAWFLGLQWLAWYQSIRGHRVAWRGRM